MLLFNHCGFLGARFVLTLALLAALFGVVPVAPVYAGVTLSAGNYRWWIQAWNDGGYGPWTSAMNFTVSP